MADIYFLFYPNVVHFLKRFYPVVKEIVKNIKSCESDRYSVLDSVDWQKSLQPQPTVFCSLGNMPSPHNTATTDESNEKIIRLVMVVIVFFRVSK